MCASIESQPTLQMGRSILRLLVGTNDAGADVPVVPLRANLQRVRVRPSMPELN